MKYRDDKKGGVTGGVLKGPKSAKKQRDRKISFRITRVFEGDDDFELGDAEEERGGLFMSATPTSPTRSPEPPPQVMSNIAPSLTRTMSMESNRSPPAKHRHGSTSSRLERQSKLSTSNPKLAWKELNDGLNNLFSTSALPPAQSPGSPSMRKSQSRPNLGDLGGLAVVSGTPPGPGVNGNATNPRAVDEVYHTVHGAGRKNAVITASRSNEPFSRIIRSRPQHAEQICVDEDEFFVLETPQLSSAGSFPILMAATVNNRKGNK